MLLKEFGEEFILPSVLVSCFLREHSTGIASNFIKDVLPGEDSEDELGLLAGLRCAGHDEVCPWLQPQLLAHFFLCEKLLRPTHRSIFPEEPTRQSPLVFIVLAHPKNIEADGEVKLLVAVPMPGLLEQGHQHSAGHLELLALLGPPDG